MVPLLLQVRGQRADVWASLLSILACNKASEVLLCIGKKRSLTTILLHQAGVLKYQSSVVLRPYLVWQHNGASCAALTALVPGASCMTWEAQPRSGVSKVGGGQSDKHYDNGFFLDTC